VSTVWDDLTGQPEAIAIFRAAATVSAAAEAEEGTDTGGPAGIVDSTSMTHSWLITGPPGSGRSNLAYAFATALLSPGTPEGDRLTKKQVDARTHPDLNVLSTERVIITRGEVKAILSASQFSPSVSRFRVMVIEDADRMTEETSNFMLKALEEPPERTVWILCAPSEADLLPTIRSRVRSVRLRVPGVDEVAKLIERRDGVAPEIALRAARESQSHIGMAHRLATSAEARSRREETLRVALGIRSVAGAVEAATRLLAIASDDAKAITVERDAEERASALRSLGVHEGGTVPAALRSQLRALEEDQKRRATRSLRDGLDRILVDLQSLYRDILLLQLDAPVDIVNAAIEPELVEAARAATPTESLATLDAIALARTRIDANVSPALSLEAMLISAIRKGSAP
jgi:DNA polymerase-3 subunit delta'